MARGSVNKVILIGTLGRDPEVRSMPNGSSVANISIATDEGYTDKATNQKVEKTEWHRVVAYGRLAEIMGEYVVKGSKVYIEGKLQTREWEKDGVIRHTTEIIANEMTMLDSRTREDNAHLGVPQVGYQQQPVTPQTGYQQQPVTPQAGYQQRPVAPQTGYQQPQAGYQQQPVTPQAGYQQRPVAPQTGYQQQPVAPQTGYQQRPVAPQAGYQHPMQSSSSE